MKLPRAALALTAAVAVLPSVVGLANLNKEEKDAIPRKKTIFHKDGFNKKKAEYINNIVKQHHAYWLQRNKESSAVAEESAPMQVQESTLVKENLSARRSLTKDAEATHSSATFGAADGAADTTVNSDAEVQNGRHRLVRKDQRDRISERRAAAQAQKDERNPDAAVADAPNKEQRGAMRELQPEPRKPNPRPPPSEVQPIRMRRDLRDHTSDDWSGGSGEPSSQPTSNPSSSEPSTQPSSQPGSEDTCIVHMTNLTPRQEFSDIFVMTHSDKLYPPLFEYGKPAFDDLAKLAQDGDTDELIWYYDGDGPGDDNVYWVSEERGPIRPGESLSFGIDASGSYDQLTLATSFIFSNDGFVAINGEEIYDGAVFWLWGIDAGVEANTQLCWTVQAIGNQFPVQAECYNDRDANLNDNSIRGVGYVHVHSGIHDLDGTEVFATFSCDDLKANNFAEYFSEIGFDDDLLLRMDDDREFLDYLKDNDDLQRYPIVDLALDSRDFFAFCDELNAITNFAQNARTFIEPHLFDFRTPMMKVELEC